MRAVLRLAAGAAAVLSLASCAHEVAPPEPSETSAHAGQAEDTLIDGPEADGEGTGQRVGAAGSPTPASDDSADSSTPDPPGVALSSVADRARALDDQLDGTVAAVAVDLQTGEWAGHQGSTTFTSASLYKLYVAGAALDLIDDGQLDLETPLGRCGSVGYALELAITVSDNACAIALGERLGWDTVEAFVEQQGFIGTTFHPVQQGDTWATAGQETTAADTADLLARLAEGELVSPDSSELLLDLLGEQYFDSGLSRALERDGAGFAHKLGTLAEISHDAGILTVGDRRYVVAVLTGNWPGWAEAAAEAAAEPALAEIGEALADYAWALEATPADAEGNASP